MGNDNNDKWWVEIIIGLIIISIGILFFINGMPVKADGWGYKSKLGALLFLLIENFGGKWFVLLICSGFGIWNIYIGVRRKMLR